MTSIDIMSAQVKRFPKKTEDFLRGDLPVLSVERTFELNMRLLDVRTSSEYAKGSIPGARNFPLFDDLERIEIGKIYKQAGQNVAIGKGLEYFEPRLENFLLSLPSEKTQKFVVYCARGGMRSASVTRLMQEHGFHVFQMQGGYKNYRQFILKKLNNQPPPLIVLHGKTGVGKTLILKSLPDHLDLEDLAQHRSSLFGAIHKIPRNQRNFEALLVQKLCKFPSGHLIFIEGESQKVGDVFIPQNLAKGMKIGKRILLNASIETRIKRIVKEYDICDDKSIQQIDLILQSLRLAIGKVKVEKLRFWLKLGEIENIVRMLLLDYYDPRYQHAMKGYKYELELSTEDLDLAALELINFRNQIIGS